MKIKPLENMEKNKKECSCGCGTCEEATNDVLTEALNIHFKTGISLTENIFRPGSENYIEMWGKVREMFNEGLINLTSGERKLLTETELGTWGEYNSKKVPLDFIFEDIIPGGLAAGMTPRDLANYHDVELPEIQAQLKKGIRVEMEHTTDPKTAAEIAMDHIYEDYKYYEKLQLEAIKTDILGGKNEFKGKPLQYRPFDELIVQMGDKLGWESDVVKALEQEFLKVPIDLNNVIKILKYYDVYDEYKHLISLNEIIKEQKDPELNKPKRGGAKKFFVYVRDPKTKNIKKVSFGDTTGLSAKINNPTARKAFAKRHDCANKNDKTKASYWSCRVGRYWKLLGGEKNFNGFW